MSRGRRPTRLPASENRRSPASSRHGRLLAASRGAAASEAVSVLARAGHPPTGRSGGHQRFCLDHFGRARPDNSVRRGSSMRQVRLGQTDLQASVIAFGTWAFGGGWGAADLEKSRDAIHHALNVGINLFDTAQGYGFGVAEQTLGEALRGSGHAVRRRSSPPRGAVCAWMATG